MWTAQEDRSFSRALISTAYVSILLVWGKGICIIFNMFIYM